MCNPKRDGRGARTSRSPLPGSHKGGIMMKRISTIALTLLVSGPLLAGCAKSPFASDGSSSTGGAKAGSVDGPVYPAAAGAAGAYGQGNAASANTVEVAASARAKDPSGQFDRYVARAQ